MVWRTGYRLRRDWRRLLPCFDSTSRIAKLLYKLLTPAIVEYASTSRRPSLQDLRGYHGL